MSSSVLLWQLFLILLVAHTLLRRRAAGGEVPYHRLFLLGLAATVVAAGVLGGVAHALVMAFLWGLAAAFGGASESAIGKKGAAAGRGKVKAPAKGGASPGAKDAHMDRLSRGEISLDEYFKEGDRQSRDSSRRLQALAATAEIAAVLARRKLSLRGFLALRERLVEVRDLEWQILSDPKSLDKLIRLAEARKTHSEIGAAFRSALARSSPVP